MKIYYSTPVISTGFINHDQYLIKEFFAESHPEIISGNISAIKDCDAIAFSSISGILNAVSAKEVLSAIDAKKPVYYIFNSSIKRVNRCGMKILNEGKNEDVFAVCYPEFKLYIPDAPNGKLGFEDDKWYIS